MTMPLTPAEARVLLHPDQAQGRQAVRTALMHLVALGHLRTEKTVRKVWLSTSTTLLLHATGRDRAGLPPHLAAVLDALALHGGKEPGLKPAEITSRLQKAFGHGYRHYLAAHLRPSLVRRGLLRAEEHRVLGLFARVRHHPTPEGERLRTQIEDGVRTAATLPDLLQRDPARAAGVATALGGMLLLADEVRPHLAALGEAVRAHQPAAAEAVLAPLGLGQDEEERRERWMESLELLAEVDWGDVLDAVDGVADAFDAGDGGGSGDGGDGGDGGGDGGGGE